MEHDAASLGSPLPGLEKVSRPAVTGPATGPTVVTTPVAFERQKVLLGLVAVLTLGGLLYTQRLFFHDDAYISLRYVQNWLDGHGLVWNRGERVEGYTSFLFVVLTALLGKVGIPLVAATRLLGVAAFIAIVFLTRRLATTLSPTEEGAGSVRFIATFLVVTSAPFVIWLYGGLETLVLGALLLGAVDACCKLLRAPSMQRVHALGAGLLFGLVLLTRPDSATLALVAGAALVYRGLRGGPHRQVGEALFFSLGFLLVVGPHLWWRHHYYGDWLPNTAYAKVSGLHGLWQLGLLYIGEFIITPPFWLPLAVGSMWLGKTSLPFRYVQASVFAFCFSVAMAGGDHMPAFRLLVPIMAPSAVLGACWLSALAQKNKRVGRLVPWLLVAEVAATFLVYGQVTDAAADVGMAIARYVQSHFPKGKTIALNSAGAMPYLISENTYIDMLGLIDKHIARREIAVRASGWQNMPGHMKGDGAYVLSRKPDYIIIGPAEGTTGDKPWFLSDAEIGPSAELANEYVLRRAEIDVAGNPEHKRYRAMASGTLVFTYYERRTGKEAEVP